MRAVRVHSYEPDGLLIDDVPAPAPGDDQILIKVAAASVNPVDWKLRDGILREVIPVALPFIPGGDAAGIVARVGKAVAGFAEGDPVFTMTDAAPAYLGAFAEYVAVRATNAAMRPGRLDDAHAAAVPLAALTAWQALHDRGEVEAGQRVLIHAAAGGVGSFAIQFAREAGAEVVATASERNRDYVRGLGAGQVIDYGVARFEEELEPVDLVIDLIGGEVQTRSLRCLRPGGRLVNAYGKLAADEAGEAGVAAVKVAVAPNGAQLARIARLIDEGRVKVEVAARFPLERVEEAFAMSRSGHVRGKIVLDVGAP